ncbi:TPA: DUF4430 domain-containing protein [Streptococcus suis]|nr:DUF4430 domain-containing protein [Streptococcus suis]HEL1639739.1 DUF4430 domain-containing protein [Streptococcus suis]HEL9645434.1 DUF4430 domain-containing protein [Streptococcus suis]
MRKLISSLAVLVSAFLLVACQQEAKQEEVHYTATIIVHFSEEKTVEKTVTVKKGDSVMDALEESFAVEETEGFITSIDGVSQDEATNTYWSYELNGEFASKGAENQLISENDKIVFSLTTFK